MNVPHHSPDDLDARTEFADLLRRSQSQLFAYIHSLVRDLNDADDLFQQVAMILWRKFAEFDRQRSFLAWSCGVARLEVSNFLRTRSRSRLYLSDELNLLLIEAQTEIPEAELAAQREALAACLQKLRARDHELVATCYGATDGVSDVAQRSGRSPQSVHNSLRRIRRSLFECIRRTLAQEFHPEVSG